jgi:hypothetical protein
MMTDLNTLPIGIKTGATGLEGLFSYTAADVETQMPIEVFGNPDIARAIDCYKEQLDSDFVSVLYSDLNVDLVPEDINLFLRYTVQFEDAELYQQNTGLFVSNLIKKAYANGHNNFTLNFEGLKPISFIGYEFEANKNNPAHFNIIGNVYEAVFGKSKNVSAFIKGNVGRDFGEESENLAVKVYGDCDMTFGYMSRNMVAFIKGNIKEQFALNARDLSIIVDGEIDNSFGTFLTNLTLVTNQDFNYFQSKEHKIISGKDVIGKHELYHEIMAKIDERMTK